MRRFLQLVTAILLAAAIPFQPVIASTMAMGTTTPSDAAPRAPCHDATMQHALVDPLHAAHAKAGDPSSAHHCSCGACCAAVAILAFPFTPEPAATTRRFNAATSVGAAVFLTAGLDRPPKDRPV
jgi:hypothetical protein